MNRRDEPLHADATNRRDESLLGVVLCGGESRRMGMDKGLIVSEGISWAERMRWKLLPWGLPVVYSIRAQQEEAYSAVMPAACLVTDAMDLAGPLNGLFSVHQLFPGMDLLLLGCDMQDLDEGTIGDLISVYRSERGVGRCKGAAGGNGGAAECYIYRDGEFAEPLCGIYTASGLQRLWESGGEDRSLKGLIRRMQVRDLAIRRREAFANYNSK